METPKPHQAYEWYNLLVARSLAPGTLLLAGGETWPWKPIAALAKQNKLPHGPTYPPNCRATDIFSFTGGHPLH